MHRRGDLPRIHGWIYAMDSGRLNVLVDGREAGQLTAANG
jgi:carbonic anhydrase